MREAPYEYGGRELGLFRAARTWKRYWSGIVRPFIGVNVLDVGAGLGSNVEYLCDSGVRWLCLEPDVHHARAIESRRLAGELPDGCGVLCGDLQILDPTLTFDTLLYVDVLEHIEDDRRELQLAAARLRHDGHLIVLAPAHQWLYSPFDDSVGHWRRYDGRSLKSITPAGLRLVTLKYLDSIGVAASAANRVLLRSAMPTERQIKMWDNVMVPLSEKIDPLLSFRVGKSIVAVWRRGDESR